MDSQVLVAMRDMDEDAMMSEKKKEENIYEKLFNVLLGDAPNRKNAQNKQRHGRFFTPWTGRSNSACSI